MLQATCVYIGNMTDNCVTISLFSQTWFYPVSNSTNITEVYLLMETIRGKDPIGFLNQSCWKTCWFM